MKAKRELVRVVRTPEGEFLLDETSKRSGRGAYICPDAACLQAAVKGKRLQKALQGNIPEEVLLSLQGKISQTVRPAQEQ